MKREILKNILRVLLSLSLLSSTLSSNAKTAEDEDRKEFMGYLDKQQNMYKLAFDKEMLLEELDYDVNNIIDFMTNKIVYQAYDGVLRGVDGTLIGRAANAHDQAITLASMLNDADIEAQIMVGELSTEQVKELNQNIATAMFPNLPSMEVKNQPKILQKLNMHIEEQLEKYKSQKIKNRNKTTENLAESIYKNISEKVQKKGQETFVEEIERSTLSYRWVRYKDDKNNWIEVHPAYAKAKKWDLKSTSIETGTVKKDDLQKLSMELWIENSEGKKYSISGKWTVPTANLTGKTLSIEIMSDALLKADNMKNLKQTLTDSHYFFVRVNGELPKEGKVFDSKGNIFSGNTIEGLNTVFSEVGKKLGTVTSMFNDSLNFDSKKKKSSVFLKKVWIEFNIKKPNSENRTIHRILFNTDEISKPENLALALLQDWDISTSTTKPMRHYYQENSTKQLLDEVTFLDKFNEVMVKNKLKKTEKILNVASSIVPNRSLVQLTNTRKFFDSISFVNTISYPSEIQLLALRKGFIKSKGSYGLYKTMDIISNNRWSFDKNSKKIVPSLLTSIKHGVWETEVETYKVVKEEAIGTLDSAFKRLSLGTNASIKTEPFNPHISKYKEKVWWQVDNKTGSTKGIIKLKQGYAGGDLAESYANLISSITSSVSEYFFITGTAGCVSGGGKPSCCVAANGALWIVGMWGGVAAKGPAGRALTQTDAITTLGIASVGFDVATSKLPVTNFCK